MQFGCREQQWAVCQSSDRWTLAQSFIRTHTHIHLLSSSLSQLYFHWGTLPPPRIRFLNGGYGKVILELRWSIGHTVIFSVGKIFFASKIGEKPPLQWKCLPSPSRLCITTITRPINKRMHSNTYESSHKNKKICMHSDESFSFVDVCSLGHFSRLVSC